jgi:tungstate transport system ATP-binding protein
VSISGAVLAAENLKVELGGIPVLHIPSFILNDKEVVTVVGPNGSGKTTLLLALACLLKPLSGRISYRGEVLDSHDAAFRFRRKISMVFQDPLLFDTTVYNNVAAGLKLRGLSKNDAKERALKYLKMFGIEHLAQRSARKLSGGESQRTSLARAFAIEPEIIFLDEPFSSLDPPTRHAVVHDLAKVLAETGTTTVMVTHVESEALNLSGRIIVMNGGRIIQHGSPSIVMENPLDEFVAKFVGMETILNGKILECENGFLSISISGKRMYALGQGSPEEEVICCIRPENISIETRDSGDAGENRNIFAGKITHIYSMGPFLKLSLDCGFPLISLVTRNAFVDLGLAEGKMIYASFKPASVHVLKQMQIVPGKPVPN